MARRARAECDGAIYHVTQRGNAGQVIFDADYERRFFLEQLETTAERYDWEWLAYCLMSNHYHLVIETRASSLGDGMRRLGTVHAQMFHRRRATYGHVFQERYGSVLVRTDAQFVHLLRYVALNPVAAGLTTDPTSWHWSSHRSMLASGGAGDSGRARVEELLEPWGGLPGARYAKLFEKSDRSACQLVDPTCGLHRPALKSLLLLTPRDEAIRAALDYGYHQTQVAEVLGVSQSTVSRWLRPAARA